jgi:hypothetical protein
MKQDEIIEMAREAGWKDLRDFDLEMNEDIFMGRSADLVAFAKLVAAKEREACAQVCEDLPAPDIYSNTDMSMWDVTCMDCSESIRARGQA